jgi:hypothetical protein
LFVLFYWHPWNTTSTTNSTTTITQPGSGTSGTQKSNSSSTTNTQPLSADARYVRALIGILVLVAQATPTSAPGDRYFGRLKMSALRIRYETMQLKKRYEAQELLPGQAEHLLILTEDAFQQWARVYPRDPWLPSTGFAIAQLYEELPERRPRPSGCASRLGEVAFPGILVRECQPRSFASRDPDEAGSGMGCAAGLAFRDADGISAQF